MHIPFKNWAAVILMGWSMPISVNCPYECSTKNYRYSIETSVETLYAFQGAKPREQENEYFRKTNWEKCILNLNRHEVDWIFLAYSGPLLFSLLFLMWLLFQVTHPLIQVQRLTIMALLCIYYINKWYEIALFERSYFIRTAEGGKEREHIESIQKHIQNTLYQCFY